jgi:hypothetical protein
MTKKILAAASILFMFLLPNGYSQTPQFGVKAGLNLASMSIDGANDSNLLPGFHAGGYAVMPLFDGTFAIQPEFLFSGKGIRIEHNNIITGQSKYNFNYIDVPVYLIYNLQEDFYFQLGPYLGFMVNASSETDASVLNFLNLDTEGDINSEYFNSIDLGLSGGMGLRFMNFDFGFNYSLGLLPVADEDDILEPIFGNAKNNVIQLYAGYRF